MFNRGFGASFIVRLVRALVRESVMMTTRDSVFFDSPLSNTGIDQVMRLMHGVFWGGRTQPLLALVV